MRSLNAQYNVANPSSLPVRLAAHARRKMYSRFLQDIRPRSGESILDVGVTSERQYEASNYLEAWYPDKKCITAVGLDDAGFLESAYPGLHFCRADGLRLPFRTAAFDIVHSSAVLEHVGDHANQRKFIEELTRVARRAVFMTTPNRWFPVEFHSLFPLMHWLPRTIFRRFLRFVGHTELAEERNLNLLKLSELKCLCADLEGWRIDLGTISMFGWPSNLLVRLYRVADKQ